MGFVDMSRAGKGTSNMMDRQIELACVEIRSLSDKKQWEAFLTKYFPNHYAQGVFNNPKLINDKDGCVMLGICKNGYGYLPHRLARRGGYIQVVDFAEFTKTKCYQDILDQGISYEVGNPAVI